MAFSKQTRRHVLGGLASASLAAMFAPPSRSAAATLDQLTVGFIYIGPRVDWGWNQSFSDAAEALGALPGTHVVEAEYLPESTDYSGSTITTQTAAYIQQIERLVQPDGAHLVFSSSIGGDPILNGVARENPKILFRHISDLVETKNPSNVGSQNALIHQGHYVNGVAAGLSTKTNKLGFVLGLATGAVLLNVNSFLLGCRHTNPKATVHIELTKGWESAKLETDATNKLVDLGCDVVTCHLDSPKTVLQTAEARGIKSCGHAYDQAFLAPKGYICGADYVWTPMFSALADKARAGEPLPPFITGGYDKGYVATSSFGAGANPESISAAKSAIAAMTLNQPIFVGPLKDNKGKVIVPDGKSYGPYAPELQATNYLLDGVIGSIS